MIKKKPLEFPEEEIYLFLQANRRQQLLYITGILAAVIFALIAVRMWLLGKPSTLYIGPVFATALLGLFVAIKRGFSTEKASVLVLGLLLCTLLMLGLLSGGLNGPIVVSAPFIPLLATLVHGRTAGVICAALTTLVVLGFAVAHYQGLEFPVQSYNTEQRNVARAAFLITFILVSTFIAFDYSRLADAMAASIWQHASKDHLTGLENRRSVDAILEREIKIARRNKYPLTVLLIDVDHFKQYNDANGHLQGDECLKSVAVALASNVYRPADSVGRYGGEEFIAILPDTSASNAAVVAENLRRGVEACALPRSPGSEQFITVSIGIAGFNGEQITDSEHILGHADAALYAAKAQGRNRAAIADTCLQAANEAADAATRQELPKTA